MDFFRGRKLLNELNTIVITLIPKSKCPSNVSDFRLISCCNVLYKCITKIICGILRRILLDLIMENEGGFVHRRFIVHNIMVVQDVVKHYGRKSASPSCMIIKSIYKRHMILWIDSFL